MCILISCLNKFDTCARKTSSNLRIYIIQAILIMKTTSELSLSYSNYENDF